VEACIERRRDSLGEGHPQPQANLINNSRRGLGGGVFKPHVAEVVFADVVVDHNDPVSHRFGHVSHRSELGPGAGIEHYEQIAVGEIGRPHLLGQ
jgi:hypothetical protein